MNIRKQILLLVLISSIAINFLACNNKADDKEKISKKDITEKEAPLEKTKKIVLSNTYTTRFHEVNKVTYPTFIFEYPNNWRIASETVTDTGEVVILLNDRGVEIKYSHIGGMVKGSLGKDGVGGSAVLMQRVEVSKAKDSNFVPSFVQGTDHSNLGAFMIARLKVTGELNMQYDSEFTDVDGATSYAVLPESWIGVIDNVRLSFEGVFAYWYSGYISFIATAPDGKFTEEEEQEVIKILASFSKKS